MTLGEKIHLLRRRQGLTLKELGKEVTISANYLARLERGEIADPGSTVVRKLAKYFQVSLDYLFGMDEEAELVGAGVDEA